MFEFGHMVTDIIIAVLWSVVALLIYNRPNRQPTFVEYMLCWACLMVMLIENFVRWM